MRIRLLIGLLLLLARRSPTFGQTTIPSLSAILLTEILFDPYSGGKDFIELYNNGTDSIQLQGITLYNSYKSGYSTGQRTISIYYMLPPGACVAISPDTLDLRRHYPVTAAARLLQHTLPSLDADYGNLRILRKDTLFDALDYDASMHHPLLHDSRGYSLERRSLQLPTQLPENWHTCAKIASPGAYSTTPGWAAPGAVAQPPTFELPSPHFFPLGNDTPQELCIRYSSVTSGVLVNIRIFDAAGRQIRTLAAKSLLDSSGAFYWDGRDADGTQAATGIYLVWIESIHPSRLLGFQVLPCALIEKP